MTQFPNPNDPPTQAAYGPPQDYPPQYPPPQPQYPPQQPQYPPQPPPQQPQYAAPPPQPPGYGYAPPAYGYPGYGPTQPPKSRLPLVLGIVGGILVLAMAVGVAFALASGGGTPSANGTTTPPAQHTPTGGATDPVGTQPAGTQPAGNGDPSGLTVGAAATVTNSSGTMTVIVNSVKYRTNGCDTGDFNISDPQPGDAYVVIEATYSVTKGQGSYNPFDWSVVDADGNESHDLGIFADCKPELNSGNNLTGKRHGLVVIEVKKGVTHGQIIYAPGFGEATATWKF